MWPNGGWPEVVPEPDRLRQVLVEPQRARDGARDLRRLERVREPRAVVVALRRHEHLGLVLEPPERLAVHDPVAVALERRAQRAVLLGPRAVGGIGARGGRREAFLLPRAHARREAGIDGRCAHASILTGAPVAGRESARSRDEGGVSRPGAAQMRVVLERGEDRPLGLRERRRRRLRRLGQRAAERADEEVVRVLPERERARLARRAHDAARGPEKPTRCSRSPHPAHAASCGAKPAASSSLSRKASAFARVARAGCASSSASWLESRWKTPRCGLAVGEQAPDRVARARRAVERAGVLAQPRMARERLRARHRQQLAAALVEHEIEPEERLQPAAEARLGAPHALGDRAQSARAPGYRGAGCDPPRRSGGSAARSPRSLGCPAWASFLRAPYYPL